MNQLNFARLFYFYRAATLGSRREAARVLRVKPETLDHQIRTLERELRADLFVINDDTMELTEQGRKALEHAEIIFGTGERLLRDLDVSVSSRTVLEIGVAATVSRSLAADLFLPLFGEEGMCPRISIADYGSLMPRLASGELHVLVSELQPQSRAANNLQTAVVRNARFALVASPGAASVVSSVAALHGSPWVHYTTTSGFRWAVDAFLRTNHVVPDVVAETDDLELMRLAAIRGFGFAAMPEAFIAADVKDGRLVRIATMDDPVPLYVSYVADGVSDFVQKAVQVLTRGAG